MAVRELRPPPTIPMKAEQSRARQSSTVGRFEVQVHDVLRVQKLQPPRHIQRDLLPQAGLPRRAGFRISAERHSG